MNNTAARLLRGALILVAAWSGSFANAEGRPHLRPPHDAVHSECVCKAAEASNGWCDACGVGYVASLRIPSPFLYELLDPHGHDVDLTNVPCTACHAAMASNGFCEAHTIGYVEGRAYVTRLAYLLAKGEPVQATADYLRLRAALELLNACEFCALACFENGRCPKCNVYYRDGKLVSAQAEKESR